jgi:hypothetical protein
MDKEHLVNEWTNAVNSASFLTAKHDPTGLAISFDTFRTVLTPEASTSLDGFIKSGEYEIRVYSDTKHPKSYGLFEIVPTGNIPFSVAGSGVQSGSLTPSGSYDCLVVAHSKKYGWHVYAEDSGRLSSGVKAGRLSLNYTF